MTAWIEELERVQAAGRPAVLVSILRTRGSSPREVGASMLVTESDVADSIGGGQLEYQCTALACEWFRQGDCGTAWTRTFPLGATGGQCCGGTVDVIFEPIANDRVPWVRALLEARRQKRHAVLLTAVDADREARRWVVPGGGDASIPDGVRRSLEAMLDGEARRPSGFYDKHTRTRFILNPVNGYQFEVALFGAGHVGSAVVHALHPLPVRIHWIDSRADAFPATLPANVISHCLQDPSKAMALLPEDPYYLVMTHSHGQDFDICTAIMEKGPFTYLGLIGSKTKKRRFERRWQAMGMDKAQVAAITCPVGIAGIKGKRPEEIAIATIAQLLSLGSPSHQDETGAYRRGSRRPLGRVLAELQN